MAPPFVLLASASPRRAEILDRLAIVHGVLHVPPAPGEDEPILPGERPADYVRRTAREKAQRAVTWLQAGGTPATIPAAWPLNWRACPILCADTTVILDDAILGKPADLTQAAAMLRRLSGRSHQVHTAIVLAMDGMLHEALSVSTVRFGTLDEEAIRAYCASGEPLGKAGAYAIQGRAAAFIEHLAGSPTGVMGLPAFETTQLLRQR